MKRITNETVTMLQTINKRRSWKKLYAKIQKVLCSIKKIWYAC